MVQKLPSNGTILGLDIGDARIGVAVAHVIAKLPRPLETIINDETLTENLQEIIKQEDVRIVVVGIPRNLDGVETAQSQKIRTQAGTLAEKLNLEIIYVDESLSSTRADVYLKEHANRGIAQDSVAACFIIEELLGSISNI